jgi:hypothetical protein
MEQRGKWNKARKSVTRRGMLEQGRKGRIKIQYLEITILTIGATGLNILGVY